MRKIARLNPDHLTIIDLQIHATLDATETTMRWHQFFCLASSLLPPCFWSSSRLEIIIEIAPALENIFIDRHMRPPRSLAIKNACPSYGNTQFHAAPVYRWGNN